jgi:hypothetical protein
MKTLWVLIIVIAVVTGLHAHKATQRSAISGKILPQGVGKTIWAIRGHDSLRLITNGGAFHIEAKPGNYTLVIDSKNPYENVFFENILVVDGKTTQLGEVKLSQ